jgi:hypothetical protein
LGQIFVLDAVTAAPFPRKETCALILPQRLAFDTMHKNTFPAGLSLMGSTVKKRLGSYEFGKGNNPRYCDSIVAKVSHCCDKILLILTVYSKQCNNKRNAEA